MRIAFCTNMNLELSMIKIFGIKIALCFPLEQIGTIQRIDEQFQDVTVKLSGIGNEQKNPL